MNMACNPWGCFRSLAAIFHHRDCNMSRRHSTTSPKQLADFSLFADESSIVQHRGSLGTTLTANGEPHPGLRVETPEAVYYDSDHPEMTYEQGTALSNPWRSDTHLHGHSQSPSHVSEGYQRPLRQFYRQSQGTLSFDTVACIHVLFAPGERQNEPIQSEGHTENDAPPITALENPTSCQLGQTMEDDGIVNVDLDGFHALAPLRTSSHERLTELRMKVELARRPEVNKRRKEMAEDVLYDIRRHTHRLQELGTHLAELRPYASI